MNQIIINGLRNTDKIDAAFVMRSVPGKLALRYPWNHYRQYKRNNQSPLHGIFQTVQGRMVMTNHRAVYNDRNQGMLLVSVSAAPVLHLC